MNINLIVWDDKLWAYLVEIRSLIKSIYVKLNCFEIVVPVTTLYLLVAQTFLEISTDSLLQSILENQLLSLNTPGTHI